MTYHTLIPCDKLKDILHNSDVRIFDCRSITGDSEGGRLAYNRAHIPGAHYIHLNDELSDLYVQGQGRHPLPSIDQFKKVLQKFAIDPGVQVVIYDDWHGGVASRMWWMLQNIGHVKVAILDGGWKSWLSHHFEISADNSPLPPPTPYSNAYHEAYTHIVTQMELEAATTSSSSCIVDSRTSERYEGISEPIDPIAGHIPTAINFPFLDNLDSSGHWKSKEELEDRFKPILDNYYPAETIFYCGSGVTACHNLLAMAHIGMDIPKLYVPSWSGWISDHQRAIVTKE